MTQAKIHIGTSGWHYKYWIGNFYPNDLPTSEFLDYYCHYFKTAEINNSFYRLPTERTLEKWRDNTPDDFLFSLKASRYITHMKKLKDPEEPLEKFLSRAEILGKKLGPIIFQLPPKWHSNPDRLESFLDSLPGRYRYAFEFRDRSWFSEPVYERLRSRKTAFCIYHLKGFISPMKITADFVYIRLHGPGDAYQGNYDQETLSGWAEKFVEWHQQGRDIYCYFDNDQRGYAADNARQLVELCAEEKNNSSIRNE